MSYEHGMAENSTWLYHGSWRPFSQSWSWAGEDGHFLWRLVGYDDCEWLRLVWKGTSSIFCALPYGSSGFSSIPLCTRGRSCYKWSGTQRLSSCRQGDVTWLSSGFASGYMLRWIWSGYPEGQASSPTFHSSLAHRGCTWSSVALPAGSPLLVEGERSGN